MKKTNLLGIMLLLVLSMTAIASAAELKDTTIDYIPYREVVAGEAGVVYKIKIINTGLSSKTYEFMPNTTAVKEIGTYRLDPANKITLRPNQEETVYFYLAIEKVIPSRIEVPLKIISGSDSTTVMLSARTIAEPTYQEHDSAFAKFMRILFYVLIVAIFIALLVIIFGKAKKGKKKQKDKEDDQEVETYY